MATEILRPNAAGTYETLSGVVGDGVGTHYTTVDEETPDDDTSLVKSYDTEEYDTYGLPDSGVGAGTINSVKVYIRCKVGGGVGAGDTCRPVIYTESTLAYGGDPQQVDTDWTGYSYTWEVNPVTEIAWTWEQIDALEAGVALAESGTTSTRCTQVYVEVDYTPVTFIPTVMII